MRGKIKRHKCNTFLSPKLNPSLLLPVCLCVVLVLQSRRGSGLVDLGVEPIQLLSGGLRQVRTRYLRRGGGRAADERLRRGRLAEVVDAGVVGVAVVVLHVGEGGRVRGGVAGVDLSVTRIVAVKQEG